MRTLFVIILCFVYTHTFSQSIKNATFTVKGNCEECKSRIENAADIKGVKVLTWNDKTKIATVTYNSEKITLTQIQQAIAKTGHDAGDAKGNEQAYNKLPKCCQYRHGICEDPKK